MHRLLLASLLILLTPVVSLASFEQPRHTKAYVAIIIDDMGNNLRRGERAIRLPGPVTFAILPNARHTLATAKSAFAARKEIIVHLPMSNLLDHPLGPGGLTTSLSREKFLQAVDLAIRNVPHAQGLNNHTGSYLTQQSTQMQWLMQDIKQRDFFFVDSRTTPYSVAQKVAIQQNIPASGRDIFLDNELSFFAIDRAFRQLIAKAHRRGTAIAIGHPHPETIAYLELALPGLAAQGIELMPASSLIALQQMQEVDRQNAIAVDIATTD